MKFRNKMYTIIVLVGMFTIGGCRLLESATSDIQGWDISACVDGFNTCFELFTDNTDKFAAGFEDALSGL